MVVNPWIEHVRSFASKKGISYFDALKHKDVKKGYKPKAKGGAVYGAPDSPPSSTPSTTYTFGTNQPATFQPPQPSRRRPRASTPRTPQSPTEAERQADLIDRADDIWFLIEDLYKEGSITMAFKKALHNDIRKILGDTRLDISAKHDALTNVMKEIRQYTDLEDQDEPSALPF